MQHTTVQAIITSKNDQAVVDQVLEDRARVGNFLLKHPLFTKFLGMVGTKFIEAHNVMHDVDNVGVAVMPIDDLPSQSDLGSRLPDLGGPVYSTPPKLPEKSAPVFSMAHASNQAPANPERMPTLV